MIADDISLIQNIRSTFTLGDQWNALSAIQFVAVVSYTLLRYYFANFSFVDQKLLIFDIKDIGNFNILIYSF